MIGRLKIDGRVPMLGGGNLKMDKQRGRLGELLMTSGASAGAGAIVVVRGGDGCACETGLAGGGMLGGVFVGVLRRVMGV